MEYIIILHFIARVKIIISSSTVALRKSQKTCERKYKLT